MKLPLDISGLGLAKALETLGYRISRQTGCHLRLNLDLPSQHHLIIPAHEPLKADTLASILADVAAHLNLNWEDLIRQIWD